MAPHRILVVALAMILTVALAACSGSDGSSSGGGGDVDYTSYSNEDFQGTWSPFQIEVHNKTYTGTVSFDANGTLYSLVIPDVPKVLAEGKMVASAGGAISGNMGIRLEWPYLHTSFSSEFTVTGDFIDKSSIQIDIGGGQVLTLTKQE